jgi:hypothetical protein
LEDEYVNLNQGAELTVSYLMARLTIEKTLNREQKIDSSKLTVLENVEELDYA